MFTYITDLFVAVPIPFLALSAVVLTAMLVFLVLQRGIHELRFRRRQRLTARCRELVDGLLGPETSDRCLVETSRVPARHRFVIETVFLRTLALSTGTPVERGRSVFRFLRGERGWGDMIRKGFERART